MSRRLVVSVVVCAVVAGITIGYVRGMPDDFVSNSRDHATEDYGYRCGDGSEFTVTPSSDMQTITIVPATSADYLRTVTLHRTKDGLVASYEGSGVKFVPKGTQIELTTTSTVSTICTSMKRPEDSLFTTIN